MKKTIQIIFPVVVLLLSFNAGAQSLNEILARNLPVVDTANNAVNMKAAAGEIYKAADQFTDEWTASYYAAYAKIMMSFRVADNTDKDRLLADADQYLATVKSLKTGNDEVEVLAALMLNARIAVDPIPRSGRYAAEFNDDLKKAKAINPENPRIYYVKGLSLFYTPKAFGGGKEAARVYFEKAVPFFNKEDESSFFKIHWGKAQNYYYLSLCK